jgi:hypothetical protein
MHRGRLFTVAWAAVTAVATLVAWQAVRIVESNVTPDATAPVALDEVSPGDPTTGSTSTTTAPEPTSGQSDGSDSPTTVVASPPPTTATAEAAPSPASSTTTAVTGETRTVSSTGGTVSVRFAGGGVELLWAQPQSGFGTTVLRQEPDRVEVEFASDDHTSRIRVRWIGAPDIDVDESGG